MKTAVVAALAASLVGLAAPLGAQNQYQQQIRAQLMRHSENARQHGYAADREPIYGQLNDDAAESLRIPLTGGVRYAIIGVCDEDCSDIDLRLWAPDGTKISEDIAVDDYPTLEFVAPASGTYRLSVEMANCSQNPCYWGVQVYAR
jgi:hypothetical protein